MNAPFFKFGLFGDEVSLIVACAIGIGFESLRLATIHPQPHDIPMDLIVTEGGPRP